MLRLLVKNITIPKSMNKENKEIAILIGLNGESVIDLTDRPKSKKWDSSTTSIMEGTLAKLVEATFLLAALHKDPSLTSVVTIEEVEEVIRGYRNGLEYLPENYQAQVKARFVSRISEKIGLNNEFLNIKPVDFESLTKALEVVQKPK